MKLQIDMIGVSGSKEHYRILCFPHGKEEIPNEDFILAQRQIELIIRNDHYNIEKGISDEFPNAWYLHVTRLEESAE